MVPREHGAWAMLLLPYITGIGVVEWTDGAGVRLALGAGGILMLFMARSPLVLLARRRYRRGAWGAGATDSVFSITVYASAGVLMFAVIQFEYGYGQLWPLGLAVLAIAVLQTWLAVVYGERSMSAEVTGVALLTLAAPLGVSLVSGMEPWLEPGPLLWLVNASYYGASIFSVKMKVAAMVKRQRRLSPREKLRLARGSIVYLASVDLVWLLLAITHRAPALAPAAFLPLAGYLIWNTITAGSRLNIKREGFTQLGLALVFTALVVIGWRSGR